VSIGSDAGPYLVITVARSGGFAGLTRRWRVEARDETDAASWRPLVDACPWDDSASDASARDRFVYRITLVEASDSPGTRTSAEHAATLPEAAVEGPWRTLVDRVQQEGRVVPATRQGGAAQA
jgi:hypothetical protein